MDLLARKDSAALPLLRYTDAAAAALLALCPVLQHYKAPLYNAALTLMVPLALYLLLRVIIGRKSVRPSDLKPVLILTVYLLFRVAVHGTSLTELGRSGVLIVLFAAAALGFLDNRWLCRTALAVSCAASLLLIVQYIGYYLFDHHIQLVPTSLLLPSAEQWILGARTGMAGISGELRTNGFYRPSAFFLEPSHLYIYLFPHLLLLLFGRRHGRREMGAAVLVSLGLVLCTSGMGIAVVCAAWGLFIVLYNEKTQTFTLANLTRRRTILLLICAAAAFAALMAVSPTLRKTVTRIFVNDPGKRTAIGGRLASALADLKNLSPRQWIFGVSDTIRGLEYNMPGIVGALYCHGVIGMLLSMEFYVKSLWRLKLPYWPAALVIVGTCFFSAHTHSTVGMMYFVLILLGGFRTARRGLPAVPPPTAPKPESADKGEKAPCAPS